MKRKPIISIIIAVAICLYSVGTIAIGFTACKYVLTYNTYLRILDRTKKTYNKNEKALNAYVEQVRANHSTTDIKVPIKNISVSYHGSEGIEGYSIEIHINSTGIVSSSGGSWGIYYTSEITPYADDKIQSPQREGTYYSYKLRKEVAPSGQTWYFSYESITERIAPHWFFYYEHHGETNIKVPPTFDWMESS